MQALPLVASGAASALGLSDEEPTLRNWNGIQVGTLRATGTLRDAVAR